MRKALLNEKGRIILNIVFSIVTGILIYLMIDPSAVFIEDIRLITGWDFCQSGITKKIPLVYTIRCYLPDMLWGYALVFALFLSCGRDKKHVKYLLLLAVVFSVIMECLQLISVVPGSFDPFDIVVEISSELLALIIIYKPDIGGKWK